MEEPKIVNANEFEDLFAKSTTQTKKKPLSEAYEKKAKPKKVIKKIMNVRAAVLFSSTRGR